MSHTRFTLLAAVLGLCALLAPQPALAQQRLTTPQEHFGFNMGDQYHLPNYQQMSSYWQLLAEQSDRVSVVSIGESEEGRPQLMAIITSPENHRNLERYRQISRRLGLAEDLDEDEARSLAAEGKAVVWLDGGLHSTETLNFVMLGETIWQMVSRDDPEMLRFLDDVVTLLVHANPDGNDLVADWYMRNPNQTQRSTSGLPRLYQKYIGHNNNRDFYIANQSESANMNRILYREWIPQIMYNHHQSGPAGTMMFAPPFRAPFNSNVDPLVISGLERVGAAMLHRFNERDMPGVTQREGASFSAWWNGGLRTTAYFHNIIGILTETVGNPTSYRIPLVPDRLVQHSNTLVNPITPRAVPFRQSLEYSLQANWAVLDHASRHRENLLLNIYRMGRNSIERGSRDHWRITPRRVEQAGLRQTSGAAGQRAFEEALHRPELRDPRGYIIPSDQPDFPTAVKFVNALGRAGIKIHRATQQFEVEGKTYPRGSLVVLCNQAFRPHIIDMFEPQDHPDDFRYPGGPPIPPYDSAGWTLAFQMGVEFDRILDGFDGPFEVADHPVPVLRGELHGGEANAGYYLSGHVNDAFIVVNRMLYAGLPVARLTEPRTVAGEQLPAGSWFFPASAEAERYVAQARQLGLHVYAAAAAPGAAAEPVRQLRIALWDRYGGSMPSGWGRWLMERFEFPFDVVYPPQLDEGILRDNYDVLLLVDGAVPSSDEELDEDPENGSRAQQLPWREPLPPRGNVSVARTVPQIREFLEQGGTVLTIGSSTNLARHLDLPIRNHLVDPETQRSLPRDVYYVPPSVLEARVDNTHPLAWGMPERVDYMFTNSPVFRVEESSDLRVVSYFDTENPLRSGWAWGPEHLEGGAAVVDARVGRGRLVLYGPEVLFRGQPHGTYKLVFNALVGVGAAEAGARN